MSLVVSWNVNSVRLRLPQIELLVKKHSPDIILLQEIKCLNESFPKMELEDLGYNLAIHGQKTFNGVAILSKSPIEDVVVNQGEQSRLIEGFTYLNNIGIRVISAYIPNGQEVGSDKFQYKMNFFEMLENKLEELLANDENLLIGGDFNIAPEPIDVYNHKSLYGSIGHHQDEMDWFKKYLNMGFSDSFRRCYPDKQEFSWWDYRAGSFQQNKGMRIDQILTCPRTTDLIEDSGVYSEFRSLPKASDHAPIFCKLKVS